MAYKSFLNRNDLSRGLRNNNPGNLIYTNIDWDGKIPYSQNKDWEGTPSNVKKKFEQYIDIRHGIRAMMRDLVNDIKKGKNNIVELISEYAPSIENKTASYINTVVNAVGLSPSATIDLSEETIIGLAKVIVLVENGSDDAKLLTDKDYKHAIDILGIPLKKKATTTPC